MHYPRGLNVYSKMTSQPLTSVVNANLVGIYWTTLYFPPSPNLTSSELCRREHDVRWIGSTDLLITPLSMTWTLTATINVIVPLWRQNHWYDRTIATTSPFIGIINDIWQSYSLYHYWIMPSHFGYFKITSLFDDITCQGSTNHSHVTWPMLNSSRDHPLSRDCKLFVTLSQLSTLSFNMTVTGLTSLTSLCHAVHWLVLW